MIRILLFFGVSTLATLSFAATTVLEEGWEYTRSEAATPEELSAELAWQPATMPQTVWGDEITPIWYRLSFTFPQEMRAAYDILLAFGGVKFSAEVWLDGKRLGKHVGGFEPFEFCVTEFARQDRADSPAPHQLLVRVEGMEAIVKDPIPWETRKPGEAIHAILHQTLLYPTGSSFSQLGIWEPVVLKTRDKVAVEDLLIQTSVRQKKIDAELELTNHTDRKQEIVVECRLATEETNIPQFAPQKVTLESCSSGKITFSQPWENPKLWNPEQPHLYFLELQFRTSEGKLLGTHRERFGFREFWCDGPDFYLNGTKFHFLATASHSRYPTARETATEMYRAVREANCNAMRLHANVWPAVWFEVADEVGMPLVLESSLFCRARSFALGDERFWKNMETHLTAMLKKYRNNPSIMMVSLCNEILHCGGLSYDSQCEVNLAKLGVLVKKLDPTRPIMFDGDMDPKLHPDDPTGVADIVNPHYPMDFNASHKSQDVFLPWDFWWIDEGKEMACYPGNFWKWDRKKPLYFGEFLHLQHWVIRDPYTLLLGDDAYRGSFNEAMARCKAKAWRMQILAYRAAGVSGMCPWTLTEPGPYAEVNGVPNPRFQAVQDSYRPILAAMRPAVRLEEKRCLAPVDIWNDTLHPQELKFTWQVRNLQNKAVFQSPQTETLTLPPAGHALRTLAWDVPENTDCQLDIRLETADGTVSVQESYPLPMPRKTLPLPDFAAEENAIGILAAESSKILSQLKKQLPQVRVLKNLEETFPTRTLILDENTLAALFPKKAIPEIATPTGVKEKLLGFLEKGGTVIILGQEVYPDGIFPVKLAPYIPWNGEKGGVLYPTYHPFLRSADPFMPVQPQEVYGGPHGMIYLWKQVYAVGRGKLVLRQQSRWEAEDFQPLAEPKKVALVDTTGTMAAVLQKGGFLFDDLTNAWEVFDFETSDYDLWYIHANSQPTEKFVKWLGQTSQSEKRPMILLHQLRPENAKNWTFVGGLPDKMQWYRHLGQIETKGNAPCLNFDLHWLQPRRADWHYRTRTPLAEDTACWVAATTQPNPTPENVQKASFREITNFTTQKKPHLREDHWVSSITVGFTYSFRNTLTEGEGFLTFLARGSSVDGEFSRLKVWLNGREQGTVELTSQWEEITLPVHAEATEETLEIRVHFINDEWDPETKEDRNLWFREMKLTPGKTIPGLTVWSEPFALGCYRNPQTGQTFLLDQINWSAPEFPETSRREYYLGSLLGSVSAARKNNFNTLSLTGASFTPSKDTYSSHGGTVFMGTNGSIFQNVHFGKTREYTFTLLASGTAEGGVYPLLKLKIGGKVVGEYQLTGRSPEMLSCTVRIPAGEHRVELQFVNDSYDPVTKADRNLRVNGLLITAH
ncbi:MAG: carbohydrate-binding domain-containing protein [Planctomycetia bacterium]|nr:carbohydrate-binding domain-containing protein [Planctomycetia bacterium]